MPDTPTPWELDRRIRNLERMMDRKVDMPVFLAEQVRRDEQHKEISKDINEVKDGQKTILRFVVFEILGVLGTALGVAFLLVRG